MIKMQQCICGESPTLTEIYSFEKQILESEIRCSRCGLKVAIALNMAGRALVEMDWDAERNRITQIWNEAVGGRNEK